MTDLFDDCRFLLIDCEICRTCGSAFETFDDAIAAIDYLSSERLEIIDDSANLHWESDKQERLRRSDKREAAVGKWRRNALHKVYHFQIDFRRCHEDQRFRALFVATAKRGGQ